MAPSRKNARPDRPARILPPLAPFDGTLEPGGEYEAIEFAGLDLTGRRADDARFVECRFAKCRLDDLTARRGRVSDSLFFETEASSFDVADGVWRDTTVEGGRIGALRAAGAAWTDVEIRGARLAFVDLTGSRLRDVSLGDCEIEELDMRDAHAVSVRFDGCSIGELNVSDARLDGVDLSRATIQRLRGVESLRGATLGRQQLTDLAPLLAAHLGIAVRE